MKKVILRLDVWKKNKLRWENQTVLEKLHKKNSCNLTLHVSHWKWSVPKSEGAKNEGKKEETLESSGAIAIWNWCPYQEIKVSSLSH